MMKDLRFTLIAELQVSLLYFYISEKKDFVIQIEQE